MPNIEELLREMIKPLVAYPEQIHIQIIETEAFMEYHLGLHQEDVGRIIGRQGRVARAIRTILYSVRDKGNKRVKLIIDGLHDE